MNIVSFHKRDLQLVIQYLSIARITGLSEQLRFFSANPREEIVAIIAQYSDHTIIPAWRLPESRYVAVVMYTVNDYEGENFRGY